MVHAVRGKEHVEWENPYDVGLIGFSSGYYAMLDCDVLLMLARTSPIAGSIQAEGVRIAEVDNRPENGGRQAAVELGIVGDVKPTLAGAGAACVSWLSRQNSHSAAHNRSDRFGTAQQGHDQWHSRNSRRAFPLKQKFPLMVWLARRSRWRH
jgi:thiamine pyrophosphate-dependent acetolactate synthase large subunit-like protein